VWEKKRRRRVACVFIHVFSAHFSPHCTPLLLAAASLEGEAGASSSHNRAETSNNNAKSAAVRWMAGPQLLVDMLDQLKRFYWSWYWPLVGCAGLGLLSVCAAHPLYGLWCKQCPSSSRSKVLERTAYGERRIGPGPV